MLSVVIFGNLKINRFIHSSILLFCCRMRKSENVEEEKYLKIASYLLFEEEAKLCVAFQFA